MDATTFKIIAVVAIFLVGMSGGFLALGVGRGRGGELFLSLGSALAAGVFLGAGLVHLLPDSISAMNSYFVGLEFPVSFLLTAVGFVFILYLEKILLRHSHDGPAPAGSLSSYALAIILSIHSVLAGAALGAEDTLAGSAIIFLAVVAHKGAAGFALVVDFQRAGFSRLESTALLALFSIMTPFGVLTGAVLDHLLQATYGRLFEGTFDALAAGTFLYIAILEIISKEFAVRERQVSKFVFLCFGLGLMAAIALFV
jgi:solute carrier family 39 (zinc transporter), member 1/2/3